MTSVVGTRWVHLFEEDAGDGDVYGPESGDVPLSRRHRRRISLSPDGSARVTVPGPDDRPGEVAATWDQDGDHVNVRSANETLRVVQKSPARLLVRRIKT